MNEAADVANNLPAIILLSLWWAFLSALDVLSRPREPQRAEQPGRNPPDTELHPVDDSPNFAKLREIDPEFDAKAFLEGACRAYEVVLQAYASGNFRTLQPLLSGDVMQAFADAWTARTERRETLELTFIGIESAEIVSVATTAKTMEIAVLFRAQTVGAERSATGDVIRGDPSSVTITADLWTFSRSVPIDGNAWVVVATDGAPEPA